jgi:uncharacterized protein YcbX
VRELGTVATVRRYPVKSMLGEELAEVAVAAGGVARDRVRALIDVQTDRVVSAKQPRLWRRLLGCTAAHAGDSLVITLPDGREVGATGDEADRALSELLDRPVALSATRAEGAALARPAPEDVIGQGQDADVGYETIEIGQGTPGATFVDYAPVHLITTSTLGHLGAEWLRYRPNLVVDTPTGVPFAENDWAGREVTIGAVRLRGLIPTPRCAIPTLEHGGLPRALHAVRTLLDENRVDVPGFGVVPCAGLYAEVLDPGTIRAGETAVLN